MLKNRFFPSLMKPLQLAVLPLAVSCLTATSAYAWGLIGHRMVTETAALLLQKSQESTQPASSKAGKTGTWGGWGSLLARHRFELGLYSVWPDTQFRVEDGQTGKLESPQHFLDLNLLPEPEKIPQDYSKASALLRQAEGKISGSVGKAPWRILNFMERAWQLLEPVKSAQGTYQSSQSSQGDARKIFNALIELGVLSHYSADVSMPFHATDDWNGFEVGHGGIHFYFENDCVDALEPGLSEAALKLALDKKKQWLQEWKADQGAPTEVVFLALKDSLKAIPEALRIDREFAILPQARAIAAPPSHAPDLSQSANKKPRKDAPRRPAREACPAFRSLITERIAKGAVLTAYLWNWVLPDGVDFSGPQPLKFSDIALSMPYPIPDFSAPSFLKQRKPGPERLF